MFTPESYTIAVEWFIKLLGLIYFFAFGALIFQIRGLLGSNGILPIEKFLDVIKYNRPNYKRFLLVPSLFWINCSNSALLFVTWAGTGLSLFLLFGIYPTITLLLLYILYLSIVSTGQDFLGFGWEGFLLEVTAHAFLLSFTVTPNVIVWISINFLLWRFHFHAGAVKLQSADLSWKNLTAIAHHYQSQPLPNTTAWFAYKLPMSIQKLSCLFMFFSELIIPFGIFLNDEFRLVTFVALVSLQLFIWATGNFSFLNHLTIVLCIILVNNSVFTSIFGIHQELVSAAPLWLDIFLTIAGTILLMLQVFRFCNQFVPNTTFARCLNLIAPFHLANRYGIFAIMTIQRVEIVIEGSMDGVEWKEYTFKYKPSELCRRPRRISPFQPRIDWQAWFLPFSYYESERWFQSLLYHILKGNKDVLKLLRGNPFEDKPPIYLRAVMYDYKFTTREERKATGEWWKREYMGGYSPVLTLK